MTIRKKLYLNFGLILGILVLMFGFSIYAFLREQAAKSAADQAIAISNATDRVRYAMLQDRLYLSNYLLGGVGSDLNRLRESFTAYRAAVADAKAKMQDPHQAEALARLDEYEQNWYESFATGIAAARQSADQGNAKVEDVQVAYLTALANSWSAKDRDAELQLRKIQEANLNELDKERQRDEAASTFTRYGIWFLTILGLVFGVFIAYRTSTSITDPLEHLMAVAREMGEKGDLNQKVDIERQDEIGELAKTFRAMVAYLKEMAEVSEAIAKGNLSVEITPRSERDTLANAFREMARGLRAMVRSVRDAAAQVAAGSNQVADASDESAKYSVQTSSAIEEVTSTMHEMSINVQNMVKNTQMQASNVSETSASIDEMVASIQRVADTAKVLLDISNRSREEVQSGIGTMNKATEGLNRINGSIGSSSTIISALGLRADDIGKIVEVIDDISEQTNLLALNAAIEAARAGEHGLGFAVVADEVRKLAEKSAQSTKEIGELIASIQKEARKAVENMEQSTRIVDEGLTLGNELSLALRKISNVVTEVYKFAQEIGAATNEQSHGSSQIAKATSRLNEITHEINSAVEEQSGGAQAVVRAMERMREMVQHSTSGTTELAASAEQMSKMARSLLESMDRFALEDHLLEEGKRPGGRYALSGHSAN